MKKKCNYIGSIVTWPLFDTSNPLDTVSGRWDVQK
jgi:hypothetical protein